ncbi:MULTISPECIES: hypothetical protein [unclassified Isoptericola]|uniref:hypothetical protein n=1 Tax=unclassified Isoptericola TaxID=2623355 RepID=UPI003663E84B
MSGPITEYGLGLAEGWHLLPYGDASEGWERELAGAILEGVEAPEGVPAALAAQLAEVRAAVDATGVRGARTAVLVESPAEPFVQAMLTLVVGRRVGRGTYESQLAQVAEGVGSAQVMGTQEIDAVVPAGTVHGAHFLIGHLPQDEDVAGVHLEERVHLGVFPADSPDMVDVTAIAAGIGIFDDFPAFVVGLLDELEVSTGVAA